MLFDKYRALRRSYTITQIHSDCDPMRGSEKGCAAIVSMSNHVDCDNRNALNKPNGTAWRDDPQKDTMILPSGYLHRKGRLAISMGRVANLIRLHTNAEQAGTMTLRPEVVWDIPTAGGAWQMRQI